MIVVNYVLLAGDVGRTESVKHDSGSSVGKTLIHSGYSNLMMLT